ncbi:hypothetical protein GY45DRAFT_783689 [Cubamyces sp. BRFM 1775]|nr:hypothetical protein GY45DRAFT_783689 [Cubamyces sp. BRFM 1775]
MWKQRRGADDVPFIAWHSARCKLRHVDWTSDASRPPAVPSSPIKRVKGGSMPDKQCSMHIARYGTQRCPTEETCASSVWASVLPERPRYVECDISAKRRKEKLTGAARNLYPIPSAPWTAHAKAQYKAPTGRVLIAPTVRSSGSRPYCRSGK